MKNKYYIPELEEFHIGFEYELKTFKNNEISWIKEELNRFHQLSFSNSPKMDGPQYRVKYLDQEDIESLGWSFEKTHVGLEDISFSIGGPEYEDVLYMDYDPTNNYIRIAWLGEGDVTRFSGTIKNKSELKKLMKQLNIRN